MSNLIEQTRVRKPEGLDLSRFRLDLKAALPAFAEAGLRIALRQDKAADALIKGVASLGVRLTHTPGELAWLLLTRALVRAASHAALTRLLPNWNGTAADWDETLAALGAELVLAQDAALQAAEYRLSPALLDRPREIPGLPEASAVLEQWLREAQFVPAEEARQAATRLPELFVHALSDEWVAHATDYKPISEALQVGLSSAAQREWAWSNYRAHLWAEYQRPLFGTDTFGVMLRLPDVYIPLRATYSQRDRGGLVRRGQPEVVRETKHAVWLEKALDQWLADPNASPVRVLGGGPGAGKSSFLKRYAALTADRGKRPAVLAELHLADVSGDLPHLLRSYLQESGLLDHDPLDLKTGERDLLVILDGLDELEKSGRPGQEAARALVREVHHYTALRREGGADIRVLLSGREVVVSALCDELKQPEQVLHLFPYYAPQSSEIVVNAALLKQDQRANWWTNFRRVTGRPDMLPASLDEITGEPLLNYLVALAQASGKLPQGENTNLNQVYEALVLDVWDRPWGKYQAVKPKQAEFFALLEEVALVTWHGDGKGATVAAIRTRCEEARLLPVLEALHQGAEAGVLSLLVAFFFRERGRNTDHDRTFEFTHKSFAEYLLARRLVYAVEEIHTQRELREKPGSRTLSGMSRSEALVHWAELCGPTLLTPNSAEFLLREMELQDRKLVASWQQCLAGLVSTLLAAEGLPMEQTRPSGQSFPQLLRAARNAEAVLLVALAACAQVTCAPSRVIWPDRSALGRWLHAFEAAGAPRFLIATFGLRALYLDGALLARAHLHGAHLVRAHLMGASLEGAHLEEAHLQEAHLEGAHLQEAHLKGALLARIRLVKANLQRAHLEGAYLEGAYLQGALLEGANLERAHLERARLMEARLEGANLQRAHLEEALLEGAHLQRALLTGASLGGAYLQRTHLEGAHLQDAHLEGAHLEGAYLEGAHLEGACLEGARLEGARLEGAHLEGARLKGALYTRTGPFHTMWPGRFDPEAAGAIALD